MTSFDPTFCPQGCGRLIPLGYSSYDTHDLGAYFYYCPLCDRAFLLIKPFQSNDYSFFCWHRVNNELEFDVAIKGRSSDLPEGLFVSFEQRLLGAVAVFRRDRGKLAQNCPSDGSIMNMLKEIRIPGRNDTVIIYFCPRCRMLLALTPDPTYGWKTLFGVIKEDNQYILVYQGSASEHERKELLSQIDFNIEPNNPSN